VLLREEVGLTDGQLLEDFISRCDSAALEALVRRHGPMVWGVCRRLLRHYHDAEDAFQTTFLVLVRKAPSIGSPELLANWLYGVARQTALKARATTAKRRMRERLVTEMPESAVTDRDLWHDLQPLLDEEWSRLSEKYRVVFVLCDLEGKTRKEAARQLGVPDGTLAARLARARVMLAKRLARHGLPASGGLLAAVLSQNASAAVPTLLMNLTIKAVTLVAAGQAAAGLISADVAALTEGVLKTMLLTKLKFAMGLLLVAGLIIGTSGMICQMQAAEQKTLKTDTEKHPATSGDTKDAIALLADEGKRVDAAQVSSAEEHYRAMEKKIRGAKSLQVALDGEVDSQDIKGTIKATIYATQGNKSRVELELDIGGKGVKQLLLTDGKARYTKEGDKGTLDPDAKKAAEEGKLVPGMIARIGLTGAMMMASGVKQGEGEKEFDLDKDAPVINFKLAAKEMVGDSPAQVVTYQLDYNGRSAQMSVWIDTKTQLPSKRVVAVDQDGQMFRITETYSTFAIDPKLEPKLFEIPKE
jgi:RNA polymerase sigma factor (sigma-70 family)